MDWLERHRAPIIAFLIAITLLGGAIFWYRHTLVPHAIEIKLTPQAPEIMVWVAGEVVSPGLYRLKADDRVVDAVEAAGGFTPEAERSSVDLAARLRDGDSIHIYKIGEVPQKVNINAAAAWLLQALPGIGETLAQRIIDYRALNGPFRRIEDLIKVEGIGEATYNELKDKITVR